MRSLHLSIPETRKSNPEKCQILSFRFGIFRYDGIFLIGYSSY
jgi:hypothetical protein